MVRHDFIFQYIGMLSKTSILEYFIHFGLSFPIK